MFVISYFAISELDLTFWNLDEGIILFLEALTNWRRLLGYTSSATELAFIEIVDKFLEICFHQP